MISNKRIFFFMTFALISQMFGQSVRYKDEIFSGYTKTSGIQYGITSTQSLDYYVGTGDAETNRPVILFIHGGGFKSGDKVSSFGTLECGGYARRGYFVVSINYRLSSTTTTDKDHFEAMVKALQDAKAAVRYLRKNWNTYGIDTTKIFATGSSAGSITALHLAYLQDAEVPSYVDMASLGGTLEGSQGNPGYTSNVQGVITNWGALADYRWMANNNIPVYCVHGTSDATVPCDSSFGDGPFKYGSIIINNYATTLGYQTGIDLFSGAGHTLDNNSTLQTQGYNASATWLYAILSNPSSPLNLTSPNGEEVWQTGSSHAITWLASSVTNINIFFSTNSGSTWTSIANSVAANSGSYAWTVPNTPSTNCLVRIVNTSDTTVKEESNVVFTISAVLPPAINIISPNGTEAFPGSTSQNITWYSTNVANIKIEFTSNNGSSWATVASSVASSAGTYTWSVPNITSTQCRIRLSNAADANLYSTSVDTFSISPAVPTISISSPTGGESWASGTSHTITWSSANVANVALEFTTNNGSNWISINSSISAAAGTYTWNVPNNISTQCKVRISDVTDASLNSVSASTFSITAAPALSVTLTAPVGGESWSAGSTHNITWSSNSIANIKIEYSSDNGSSWNTVITSTVASNRYYGWTLPSLVSSVCKVRISNAADASLSSISAATFSITAPGAGQSLYLEENFISSSLVPVAGTNGWANVTGTNSGTQISYVDSNLTFGVYPTNTGKAVYFSTGATGKIFKNFSYSASSAVYLAFLIKIPTAAQSFTNHIIGFGSGNMATTATYELKVYCKWNAITSSYNFGIGGSSATYSSNPTSVPAQSTALILLKYDLGNTADVYVFNNSNAYPYTIPATSEAHITGITAFVPSCVYLRSQSTLTVSAIVDGIRVSGDASPLPVELSLFDVSVKENAVHLNWETKTEFNSAEFVIQRKCTGRETEWESVARVPAHGTSFSPIRYNFIDNIAKAGSYTYRLKQIDNDGSFSYSEVKYVAVALPTTMKLSQNYPNPFNPSTVISYSLNNTACVTLELFSSTGEKIETLINTIQNPGSYNFTLNMESHRLTSGVYLYRMTCVDITNSEIYSFSKKMLFLK